MRDRSLKHPSRPVIVIGGSDPSGGAGIQADLFTLHSLGIPAFSVVTALTVQNEKKFISYETVPVKNFCGQLESLSPFAQGGFVKIGMLGRGRLIPPLIAWLKKMKPSFVILDPVFRSSTGYPLLDNKGVGLLQKELIPLVDLITPNIPEAEAMTGIKIKDKKGMEEAGRRLLESVKCVLIKGGHLKGAPLDLLWDGKKIFTFSAPRIPGKGAHGTGCTLASAIVGYLSLGKSLHDAIRGARRMVLRKLLETRRFG